MKGNERLSMKILIRKAATFFYRLSTYFLRLVQDPPLEPTAAPSAIDAPSSAAIVITTFSPRFFSDCEPLVRGLRRSGVELPIFIVINTDGENRINEERRSEFLRRLSDIKDCHPICSGRDLGMAAMWNLGIRLAGKELVIVLNDDLLLNEDLVVDAVEEMLVTAKEAHLAIMNYNFGIFAISLKCINEIGWFDERFLSFGEEDGDYVWRYEDAFGKLPPVIRHGGMLNQVKNSGYERIVSRPDSKYSLFNRVYLRLKYSFEDGTHKGYFDRPARKILPELEYFTGDSWYRDLGHLLSEPSEDVVHKEISEKLKLE